MLLLPPVTPATSEVWPRSIAIFLVVEFSSSATSVFHSRMMHKHTNAAVITVNLETCRRLLRLFVVADPWWAAMAHAKILWITFSCTRHASLARCWVHSCQQQLEASSRAIEDVTRKYCSVCDEILWERVHWIIWLLLYEVFVQGSPRASDFDWYFRSNNPNT